MKPIGLFGGTFDPVHFGHLRPLLDLRDSLPFAEIRVLPCARPAHRNSPLASAEDRTAMLRLALEGVDGVALDLRELDRTGPTYTVDTLLSLRGEMPSTPLCWILGMDAFAGIDRWHRWQELLELAHLIVCRRPDAKAPHGQAARLLRAHGTDSPWRLSAAPAGRILTWPVTQLDISATRLRQLAASGQDLRFFLPEAVRLYLHEHRLYSRQPRPSVASTGIQ